MADLARDAAGTLWVATRERGLWRLHGGEARAVEGLPGRGAQALLAPRADGLWVALVPRGLARLDGGRFGAVDLPDDHVHALAETRDGLILAGTRRGGLAVWHGGRLRVLAAQTWLHDDVIHDVIEDGRGDLWTSSFRGLGRVDRAALDAFLAGRTGWVAAASYEALETGATFVGPGKGNPMAWRAGDGRLWFGSRAGLVALSPQRLPWNRRPPPVIIQGLLAGGRPVDGLSGEVRLGPGRRDLRLDFAVLSLDQPHEARVRYQLEGFEAAPHFARGVRSAAYTNLPPGSYRFTLAAANADGTWSAPAALPVALAPRVHETRWFLAACGLLVAGVLAGLYRWRLANLRARYAAVTNERARVAGELHDTLLQGVTALAMQLDAAARSGTPQALEVARGMVSHLLDEARRFVGGLRPEAPGRSDLAVALETTGRRLLGARPVAYVVRVEGAPRPLPHHRQDALFRVGREAIANALAHGDPARVEVVLRYGSGVVELTVRDDGRGFAVPEGGLPASPPGHMGLSAMKHRADQVGAQLAITSAPGAGANVTLRVEG